MHLHFFHVRGVIFHHFHLALHLGILHHLEKKNQGKKINACILF